MQNVQVLLQPTEMDTQPAYADSRLAGSVDGNTSSASRISISARALCRDRSNSVGSEPTLCVPNTTSTHGARRRISPRSFCARQPPTAICMPGLPALTEARCPRLPYSLLSAFSLTAQVLKTTTSAVSPRSVGVYPARSSSPDNRSESCTFIWQP